MPMTVPKPRPLNLTNGVSPPAAALHHSNRRGANRWLSALMKNPRRFVNTFLLLGITLVLLYALSSGDSAAPGHLTPASTRKRVANITVADLSGNSWKLDDHRGQVVLLNFWATWCPPCRQETPGLVRLAHDYSRNGLAVLGISMDDGTLDVVREFVSDFKIQYPVTLFDQQLALARTVQALPTTLLIDKSGRLAKTYTGGASESTFRADVDALLRESTDVAGKVRSPRGEFTSVLSEPRAHSIH
jgi:cytochrome c biogenesis protein CcmG, thiol:disulfide interchange protein DsbE